MCSGQRQVVAVNEFRLVDIADQGFDLGASWQRVHLNDAVALTGTGAKVGQNFQSGNSYVGYVTAPIGSKFLVTLEAAKSSGDQSQGAKGYTFIGEYLFSKRTKAYAMVGYNKMNSDNVGTTKLGTLNLAVEAGKSLTAGMVGLQHTF